MKKFFIASATGLLVVTAISFLTHDYKLIFYYIISLVVCSFFSQIHLNITVVADKEVQESNPRDTWQERMEAAVEADRRRRESSGYTDDGF